MEKLWNGIVVVTLVVAIILCYTVLGNKLTDPTTYSHTLEVLDENRTSVLGLTAASAVASAAISSLPDDMCTPLAEEISELTTYFLMILSVIYLEKYLLTILAGASCYLLVPAGSAALLVNRFFPRNFLRNIGGKLLIFGVAVLLVIPTSVWVSDQINGIYAGSIELTVESATAVSENLISGSTGEGEESASVIDEAKSLLGNLTGSVTAVVEQFKNILNRFIEAIAVMIVTTCLIPILVILFFGWLIKTLFSVPVVIPPQLSGIRKRKHGHGEETGMAVTE